jgi:D-beta-D-heptose 7-phosphate kinase/D-beta-D-heptose 1-phosphate adenosyltransferase
MTIQVPKKYKILLIGDACTDVYQYGTVDRISPEAPVPVFEYTNGEIRDGMSGNVKLNLEALGCKVIHLHGNLSTKTRLIDQRSHQQLLRIDEDAHSLNLESHKIKDLDVDCIVISDYDKGFVSYELVETLRARFSGPIFVDTKKTDLARFEGCYVKVNQLEYSRSTSRCTDLIVTLGEEGATYQNQQFLAQPVELADVTGAGDTFISALAYWYMNTGGITESIKFAIRASSVTVQHHGTYAPTLGEIG